ncbi:concanavalin A-like lectin/glucanase domain-containing protein [Xylariaceae sp. FL0662B]|nr:concanavalin A-like lectin/glucanase domain-containing protein [Xylariaceae sp. FL0662B]
MVFPRHLQPLVVVSILITLPAAAFPEVGDDRCNCYLTNDSSENYFTTHKFFDFRELSDYAGVPGLIADPLESSQADATSDYFTSDEWTQNWGIQGWNNSALLNQGDASVLMVHSPNNIYIEKNQDENPSSSTFMTLRTFRLKDYQSAAEFESISQAYHFVSARMYARTKGNPGAVTAMFTYLDPGDSAELTAVQESDLEIRTVDPPDSIQYTNQPSYTSNGFDVPEATRNITMPGGQNWTDWAVYRMDWNPTRTSWYIDGVNVASISFQTPRDPSMLIFNTWSDGGNWSGNMSVGGEAYLHVQWIELVYNSTGNAKTTDKRNEIYSTIHAEKRDEQLCHNVCSIDDTAKIGTPVLLQGGASRLLSQFGSFGAVYFSIPVLSMVFTYAFC